METGFGGMNTSTTERSIFDIVLLKSQKTLHHPDEDLRKPIKYHREQLDRVSKNLDSTVVLATLAVGWSILRIKRLNSTVSWGKPRQSPNAVL